MVAITDSWVFGQETQPNFGLSCIPPGSDCVPFPQERLAVLDSQAGQIRAQALQESERLARDKNAALQLLQKVAGLGSRERRETWGWVRGEEYRKLGWDCQRRSRVWVFTLASMALTLLSWPPGEGETDGAREAISCAHGREAFSQDHFDPQRGNMAG